MDFGGSLMGALFGEELMNPDPDTIAVSPSFQLSCQKKILCQTCFFVPLQKLPGESIGLWWLLDGSLVEEELMDPDHDTIAVSIQLLSFFLDSPSEGLMTFLLSIELSSNA